MGDERDPGELGRARVVRGGVVGDLRELLEAGRVGPRPELVCMIVGDVQDLLAVVPVQRVGRAGAARVER